MNKIFCALAALSLAVGCNDVDNSKETDNALTQEKLIGTWVMKVVDGEVVPTNEYFVVDFNADGTQNYMGQSVVAEDGTSTWVAKEGVNYTVKDNTIYLLSETDDIQLNGSISKGELCGEKGDILSYRELVNVDGGEDRFDNRSFAGIRSEVDYSGEILGTWDATIIEGDIKEPFDTFRMAIKRNGLFSFYAQDENGEWVLVDGGDGYYCVMGDLFGTQWNEGELTFSEAWEIAIDGDNMTWRGVRDDNPTAGFDLVRVVE